MSTRSVVYFIQSGENGPIKIGYTAEDVDARLRLLQCGNPEPLTLLVTTLGGIVRERELHEEFKAGRFRGEWFRPDTPGLQAFIEAARTQEDVIEWQLRDDGEQLCEYCRVGVVLSPRRSLCSDECAKASHREKANRQ